jgi:ABC-2 type transport system ATP-binding protein
VSAAIALDDVRKTFVVRAKKGRLRRERTILNAVDGITLNVEEGELLGYLGPNGAGKSTTIKMLTGILVPSSGRVRVAGFDPARQRIELTRRIGVVFGQRVQLWWDLPLRDSFELLRHVYRVPKLRYEENLARFTELLELGPFLGTPVRQSRSASACAATSPPRCSMIRKSSSSTSRRSGSTSSPSSAFATSSWS